MQTPKFNPSNAKPRVGPLLLPAGGRKGPTPKWPIEPPADAEEKAHWARLWRKPQAVVWEQQELHEVVARYCRIAVAATKRDAYASVMAQASSLEDRLGLTPRAMRMLLWQIAPDEVADKRDEKTEPVRARLRAVENG